MKNSKPGMDRPKNSCCDIGPEVNTKGNKDRNDKSQLSNTGSHTMSRLAPEAETIIGWEGEISFTCV